MQIENNKAILSVFEDNVVGKLIELKDAGYKTIYLGETTIVMERIKENDIKNGTSNSQYGC